jgi:hypothetical protein
MKSENSGSTRRGFLSGALAASTYVWIPKRVNGYSAVEMLSTAVNNRAKPGISKWELDTPALLVDLDKMEANIAKMQSTLKKNNLPSRPHAKTHKTAAIAKYQIDTCPYQ